MTTTQQAPPEKERITPLTVIRDAHAAGPQGKVGPATAAAILRALAAAGFDVVAKQ